MKFAVYWAHKTGHPPVLIFEFSAKTEKGAEKIADDVIPKTNRAGAEIRRFCKVSALVPKKGGKRGR